MKRLTLFRHAKSSWRERGLPDRDRPLSSRGQRDAPTMAQRLAARQGRPSLILTSNAVRTKATAKLVAEVLGYPEYLVQVERSLYLASADTILSVIAAQDDASTDLLVVGHNPGMTEVANRLLPELALDNLPTAGIVVLEAPAARWIDLPTAACRLLYYDYPKKPA